MLDDWWQPKYLSLELKAQKQYPVKQSVIINQESFKFQRILTILRNT
jgi:hypothetical protein